MHCGFAAKPLGAWHGPGARPGGSSCDCAQCPRPRRWALSGVRPTRTDDDWISTEEGLGRQLGPGRIGGTRTWSFSARARVPRAARGGGALGSDQGRGAGGTGLWQWWWWGGIAQRQARTVAATGATDKRVESQRQALRQRDCPSPKDRLEGGRRRRDERRQGGGRHLVLAAHTQPRDVLCPS